MTVSTFADIVGVAPTVTVTSWPEGTEVSERMRIDYSPLDAENVSVAVDGMVIASATTPGAFYWTPQTTGNHTLTHTAGETVWEMTVNVTKVDRVDTKLSEPPMEVVETITITPTERAFTAKGGMGSVRTKGTGDWTAAVSDDWITLSGTDGTASASVMFRVEENTAVESRTGYVYVAGRVFTIAQAGVGATLDRYSADIDKVGGEGIVTVCAGEGVTWRAWSNADWLSVSSTEGEGMCEVTWTAAPWNERSTRTGTLIIAGQAFTVMQEGQFVWLGENRLSCDAKGREVEIDVNTLTEEVEWSVMSNEDWIRVTDAGCGIGSGCVRIAVDENTGYWERMGSVSVNRETFTITQAARPPDVGAFETAFDARGSAVMVGVTTDARVAWSVANLPEWLTASATVLNGSGEIVLTAAANSTLLERSAEITIAGRMFTVTQAAREVQSIECDVTVFDKYGDMGRVTVNVEDDVAWTAEIDVDWIMVWDVSDTSGTGGGGFEFLVDFCEEAECARMGTIRVGDKCVVISQRAGMTLETAVPVPYSWLESHYGTMDEAGYEAKAQETAANGVNTVEEAFVAGFSPTNAAARFMVAIVPGADGGFALEPNPPPKEGRKYMAKGTDDLTKPEAIWPEAELGDERFIETNRFFRVRVEME